MAENCRQGAGGGLAGREKYPAIDEGAGAMTAYQHALQIDAGFRRMTVAQ